MTKYGNFQNDIYTHNDIEYFFCMGYVLPLSTFNEYINATCPMGKKCAKSILNHMPFCFSNIVDITQDHHEWQSLEEITNIHNEVKNLPF